MRISAAGLALALSAIVFATAPSPAAGQRVDWRDSIRDDRNFSFYDHGPYRSNVPRPESLLGYDVGDANTQYAAQQEVLLAIANAASDRVKVEEFGSSYERRTMRLFIVSAPENIQRLDSIRADVARLADPRSLTPAQRDALLERTPIIVWINESVHGNESPGFEAAMQTLYQLAASEEPATQEVLRNTVIVLNPSSNPDGHERFAVWYNSINVENPDPDAMEHDEPWSIQGRFNHYRFDLNRDVMTTTQREAQALVRAMLRWHPMVAIDQHGQVETYFFPPAASPVNENLAPGSARWLAEFGRANAAAFDQYGWMYFVRDVYDLFGPFYWDTWPSLTGATGMTYETDGGGWKGIEWRREDGSIVSFRDGIAKHFVTAMSTIHTASANRAARMRDYVEFRQAAIDEGRSGRIKRVVLVPNQDPGRASDLVASLVRSGIEVRKVTQPFSSARAHPYDGGDASSRRFDSGVFVVDLAQPQGRMARAFLEPSPRLDSSFVAEQLRRFERNSRRASPAEGYEFYDVTAWSLPIVFGVEAYWTEDAAPVEGNLMTLPPEEPALLSAGRAAGELSQNAATGGVTTDSRARSAYLFTPQRNGSARLAYHLLDEGYRVAVATRAIEAGGEQWPRGTYIVRVARNDTTLHSRIDQLARRSGVQVTGVNSAFTEEGQFGIGSESVTSLVLPRIALVGGDGISQTSYGSTWWTFERRYDMAFTPVTLDYLAGGGDLAKFNVIVIPDASAGALARRIGKSGAERLAGWIENGGTLITMSGASAWAAREDVSLTSSRLVGTEDSSDSTNGAPASSEEDSASEASSRDSTLVPVRSPGADDDSPAPLPGSNFFVELDRTHWLTHGFSDPRITVLLDGRAFFKLSKRGTNVAVFPESGTLVQSGWVWPDNTERLLRGTSYLIEEREGDGHAVIFAGDPFFRGWWRALDRLVLNAILLGPAM